MEKLFGTDGVRGIANKFLTPELAFSLGRAGAYFIAGRNKSGKIVVGKDTRISADMLEGALDAGICSVGIDVLNVGILPTPAVAYLTKELKADAGVMISASHNPIEDNGIKFFSSSGFKIQDKIESKIENWVRHEDLKLPRAVAGAVGRIIKVSAAQDIYLNYIKKKVNVTLEGLRVVLDCAHGAAYEAAPKLLQDMGAHVFVLNNQPNGVNINVDCGSTYPETLQKVVLACRADLGIAFDGDSDRAIAVDEAGSLVDGDKIMAVFAEYLKEKKELKNNKIVTTVMSNFALERALTQRGIKLIRTRVGDRFVLEEMKKQGCILGGEQSGHIILLNYNTTGDGILTAAFIMKIMKEKKLSLNKLASVFMPMPQILVNVKTENKKHLTGDSQIKKSIETIEKTLKDRGRILVRPSGTEPIIRVMAEGPDKKELKFLVGKLASLIEKKLN